MTTEQRLERLERQNGRLKRGMIGMVVASLSLLVMGQALPPKVHDVLVAKTFVLKDGKGNERARLWSAALGPRLTFYAETGTTPESISADFTGGGLYLYARSVGGRAVLFADRHGMGFETSFKGKRVISVLSTARMNAQGNITYGKGRLIQYNRVGDPKNVWPPR